MATVEHDVRVREEVPAEVKHPELLEAADLIRKSCLRKGLWTEGGDGFCALGAVFQVRYGGWDRRGNDQGKDVARALEFFSTGDLFTWNDAPERTKEEVIERLERAAYGV